MLYIVGTPIGNLDDLSLRQARTIAQSDIILTEDTRSTGILMKKIKEMFGLSPPPDQKLVSYYREKEFEKLPQIIQYLHEDRTVALISESGMPVISDPGLLLVRTVIKEQLPFTVIPGPTAAVTTLIYAGVDPQFSLFVGFLPKNQNKRKKLLNQLVGIKEIICETKFIIYESPQRIINTLNDIQSLFPNNQIVIGREITKKFEEIIRGTALELRQRTYKGEITLVLS